VTGALQPRHRHQEFLAFLQQIERTYRNVLDPETGQPVELHLVMDNYAAHKHTNMRQRREANPRFKIHFTPTHASWMNLVEVWFGIRAFIDGWNDRSHPFVWTKTAEQILVKANCVTASSSRD
jgi:DDE superfamily endonuclease